MRPEEPETVCAHGMAPGQTAIRGGNLCTLGVDGRLYIRAPRRADVHLAERLGAHMQAAGGDPLLPAGAAVRYTASKDKG